MSAMIRLPACACHGVPSRPLSIGVASFVILALLVYEHGLVKPNDFSRVNAAFFTVNGYVSVLFFVFWAPTFCIDAI